MTPDRGFVKQLKKLNPELEVLWDWGSEVWEIWHFPTGGEGMPYLVTRVQTTGRTYRELGADILLSLQMCMNLGIDKVIDYIDESNNQIMRRKRQTFLDKIQWASRDNYDAIFNIRGKPLASTNGAPWLIERPKTFNLAEGVSNG